MIGQSLGQLLSAKGYEIFVVTRELKAAQKNLSFKAHLIEGDLSHSVLALPLVDGVIHLMGESVAERWSEKKKVAIRKSREVATKNLVQSLASQNLKFVVSASAIGIYGSRNDEVLTENSSIGNHSNFLTDVCVNWEKEIETVKAERTVKIRIGVVLHPHQGALVQMKWPFKAGVGGAIGSGQQYMSWIHHEDLVSAIVHLVENKSSKGLYNLTAPNPVTNKIFSRDLALILNRPLGLPVPEFALNLLYGEMAEVILASARVLPQNLLNEGFRFQYPDHETALRSCLQDQQGTTEVMYAEQFIPQPIEKVFIFFSEAKNLEVITPEFLHFNIENISTEKIDLGTLIQYKLKIHGVPIKWKTLIEDWQPPYQFVDTQLSGPYKKWHHTHIFKKVEGGTLMTDRVVYQLPVGYLGWLGGLPLVKNDIQKIFDFRRDYIFKYFSALK